MKKFIVLYSAPIELQKQMMQGSPEEMKGIMDKWMAWHDAHKEAVVDLGTPLGNATNITKEGSTKNETWTSGYSIMQGDSMEEIVEALKDHPHLDFPQCAIQVYECFPTPGME